MSIDGSTPVSTAARLAAFARVAPINPYALLRSPLVNTNVESEAKIDDGLVDCGAVWEMEVVWPSGAGLRKQASNHHEGRWLKTVVLSVVGKGVTVIASGMDREDER
ncbi:hypothetical protein [Micromonospora craniellae]|uniref:hypothetical protein n=1 Tax=Micromonospora craniellae TaxID=2294034 RepID=UPI00168B90EF|nr:hypothetical protein [Micromonospora craniellae]QOC90833.1 hypothetical protein ID554_22405 [Micromonospora craniellae]QOC90840.1 hypothetical protein ID554_22460 [Micromonospora craniellae]